MTRAIWFVREGELDTVHVGPSTHDSQGKRVISPPHVLNSTCSCNPQGLQTSPRDADILIVHQFKPTRHHTVL